MKSLSWYVRVGLSRSWPRLKRWARARRKALAAVAVPVIVFVAARYGLSLDVEAVAALTALISGAVVHQVPNVSN